LNPNRVILVNSVFKKIFVQKKKKSRNLLKKWRKKIIAKTFHF